MSGNLIALNALAGIPYKELAGFRAPFLNYSVETLQDLAKQKFTYDSSASTSVAVTDNNTDAFWPYTLDNGLANDCMVDGLTGVCQGQPKIPGLWEIPMYTTFNPDKTQLGLMDPWLEASTDKVLAAMKATFTDHYNTQKTPFGIYSHPIHISLTYPGAPVAANQAMVTMLNQFLDFAMTSSQFQNVWMINNKQLLAWMKNPVPASQLNTLPEFQCQVPNPNQDKICSGIPAKEDSVMLKCISDVQGDSLNNSPFNVSICRDYHKMQLIFTHFILAFIFRRATAAQLQDQLLTIRTPPKRTMMEVYVPESALIVKRHCESKKKKRCRIFD